MQRNEEQAFLLLDPTGKGGDRTPLRLIGNVNEAGRCLASGNSGIALALDPARRGCVHQALLRNELPRQVASLGVTQFATLKWCEHARVALLSKWDSQGA